MMPTSGKIKWLALAALCALALFAGQAKAQVLATPTGDKPELATADLIAKTWYRLSGQTPNFEAWAELTDEYKKAGEFEKPAVRAAQAKILSAGFDLLVPGDQFTADMPVQLSDYSLKNKGFIIENFTPTTFIRFSAGGEDFAVVPRGLIDMQWIPVDGAAAKAIDDIRLKGLDGKTATLTLTLAPTFAAPKPVTTETGTLRVLSADVISLAIFDAAGKVVWRQQQSQPDVAPKDSARQSELMQLYQ